MPGEVITCPRVASRTAARRPAAAFTLLGAVQVLMIVTMSMLSACLSSVQRSLHTPTSMLSLTTAAYGISFAGLLLLAGGIVDRGRARRVLAAALMVFVLGALVCGAAPTTFVLLAGRVVQGAGAALAVPAALTLVGRVYPDGAERAWAMAIWGVLGGLGGITGLLYGGVIGALLSWRWTFAVPAVLAVAIVVVLPRVAPDTPAAASGTLDFAGAAAATVALGASSYALVTAPHHGWGSSRVLGCFAAAAAAAVVWVAAERRTRTPLVPAGLLRSRRRIMALLTVFLASAAMTTVYFMLALHFQQVLGWNEWFTALGFAPLGATLLLASLVMSRIILVHISPVVGLPIGTGIAALGLWLSGMATGAGDYRSLIPGLVVLPVGVMMMFATATAVGMRDVTESTVGRASGLLNAVMEAGPTFGLAAIVSLATAISTAASRHPTAEQTSHGFAKALQTTAGAYLVIAVLIAVGLTATQRNDQPKGQRP